METLDVHEAAKLLHCHVDTVYVGAKSGKIPGVKVGRAWVFVAEDLVQYLRSRYAKQTDKEGNRWGSTSEKTPPTGGAASASKAGTYVKARDRVIANKPSSMRRQRRV